MPDRHFYLLRHHILFYIKFLLFCSLAPDEIKILCRKNKGVSPEEFVYTKSTGQDWYVKLLKYIYIYNIINIKNKGYL